MSIRDTIQAFLTNEPGIEYDVSPRKTVFGTTSAAWVAATQQASQLNLAAATLYPTDAIFIEQWTGIVFGDAVATSSFTVNGFSTEIGNSAGMGILVVGQPAFTILAPAGSAASAPIAAYSVSISTPLVTYKDLQQLAAQSAIAFTQPLQFQTIVQALNGAAASHLQQEAFVLYRAVRGLNE